MAERLVLHDTEEKVNSQTVGDCSTFVFGWDFPYTKFFTDPVGYFQSQGYEIVTNTIKTGDIVFFAGADTEAKPFFGITHVAIAQEFPDEMMFVSRLDVTEFGRKGKLALTTTDELQQNYGNIVLIVRPPTPQTTPYNLPAHYEYYPSGK